MAILLGPVKPWTLAAYKEIQAKFPCDSVFGNPSQGALDHLEGRALDFMVWQDTNKGNAIASYAIANYQRLNIGYVIWWQRIWYPNSGWRQMPDRGSVNMNHKNHVHIDFLATPPKNTGAAVVNVSTPTTAQNVSNPIDQIQSLISALNWITTPANLGRVALFLLGVGMIAVTVGRAMNASQVTKVIKNVSA